MPISSAMMVRIACGIWVAQLSVTRRLVGSQAACAARASSGSAFCRRDRMSILMRRCAAAMVASKPLVFTRPSTITLAAASPCTRGAPGASAAARIDHRRRLLDLDLDLIGDVLGLLPGRRHHGRDRLADEAHDTGRQHRLADRHIVELVQHRPDRLHRRKVGGRDHRRACGRIDPHDPPGRDRAAHEAHPAGRRQVAGEAALAGDQGRVLDPADRAADPAAIAFGMGDHRARPLQRSRANTRRGLPSAIASISAADNPAERSSASGSMSAGGNE